jgi:protein-L-isoaspartate(D-aspartate) O-methyltransferase
MDRLQAHRQFFADLITSSAGISRGDRRLASAFATVPRENFLGPGPWKVFTASGPVETPSDDPAFLYQDVVVAIAPDRGINNGQPLLHAISIAALNLEHTETVLHIGAGTGYYTAILSKLVGPNGSVIAYEIEEDLAARAARNLAQYTNTSVHHRSATEGPLPECDAIYVSAGATAPLDIWIDALRPNGRLLFPLTPGDSPGGAPGAGAMLLLTPVSSDDFHARFISPAMFIPCVGARDEATSADLAAAFKRGDYRYVRSLHRNSVPDQTAWFAGNGWWLSTSEIA